MGMNRQPHGWLAASEPTHLLVLPSCCVLGFMHLGRMALTQLAHIVDLPPENYAIRKLAVRPVAHQALQANSMFPSLSTNSAIGKSRSCTLVGEKD